jgi:hypothetical protein
VGKSRPVDAAPMAAALWVRTLRRVVMVSLLLWVGMMLVGGEPGRE